MPQPSAESSTTSDQTRDRTDQRGYRPDATVHGLFRERAQQHPERVALCWDGGTLRYGELDRRSDALAQRLRALGANTDKPIALCLPRSPQAVVAALAILKAGGAYLPLDPDYPAARLRHIVQDAAAAILITDAAHASAMHGIAPQMLSIDALDEGSRDDAPASADALRETTTAGGLAYVMYTSGSTGQPKGVQIEHRSIVRLVGDVDYVRLDADTCFLHAAPLGFDASTLEIWGPLLNGGRCAILTAPVPDARALREAIDGLGATTAWLTAALFNAVIDEAPQALRGLRQLFTGGEALSPGHVRRALQALPDTSLHNGYGPTECTTFATTYAIPRDLAEDVANIPIGRPIADTHVHVLDAQQRPVADGDTGELYIGGRGLARGYLGRPDLDAERFIADPLVAGARLYRTGDLVRWRDEQGCDDTVLEFVGRVDDQLKIRGFRIEPGEIEAVLSRHPGVRACAVVAKPAPGGGKRLIAYVVADAWDAAQARAALAHELPDYMVPAALVRLDALPITANGKLDRAALPTPTGARPDLQHPYRAPRGERETALCAAFADVLELDRVGTRDAFFELGGDSLSALRLLQTLRTRGIGDLRPVQLFEAPTPAGLARLLDGDASSMTMMKSNSDASIAKEPIANEPIAIVGMAGRFPGAEDIEAFWRNLCAGQESIRIFAPDELDPSIPRAMIDDPAYVRARGVLDNVDRFDAAFFGIPPLEAQLMDPQHRLFLETAWHALEHAGYVPDSAPGRIGVFGGMYNATYYRHHVQPRPDLIARFGELPTMLANEKDYLTSRVAYKLGLDGPAVSVHTACSTSLVATVMAMDSLRSGQCALALAGGVAVTCPPNSGYLYQEGSMASVDGHTRTFDADAAGTVFSDGVAMLALRRLSDAVADGDTVYAVLLGGAVNNDGAERASFTAPNPAGQAMVIAMAHDAAGIDARSVSYVEAHGTATPIGDPIEVAGLTRAFRRHTDDRGFCGIGSLKSNVGHLVTAAGAAGLIKTALALHRETLPPTIGYARPNPQIDFESSPFVPQAALQAWPRTAQPRRAGVSAFGFGGTNAHVVLQEAPLAPAAAPSLRPLQLLTLSARTPEALATLSQRMATYLDNVDTAALPLADLAHTARIGRRAFAYRRSVVAADHAEAARLFAAENAANTTAVSDAREVAFMCPGQGAQYPAMGRGLYAAEPAFREAYDACCAVLATQMDIGAATADDVRDLFFSDAADVLTATQITQPAVFALEYALARLWISWGVQPQALIGHSVGEFVCAALAGVMSLADALSLVALRGKLMQAQPAGSMLSVRLSAAAIAPYLDDAVELAAENSPNLCVVAGPTPDIERLEARLASEGVVAKRLVTSHAFHSAMMQPVVAPMQAQLQAITLHAPHTPILSTVTGDWLSDAEACDPRYWAEHLRWPVRFAPAASRLLDDPNRLLIEVGPRGTLATLAKQCAPKGRSGTVAIASLGDTDINESASLAQALGQAWTLGVAPDWHAYVAHEARRRVPLPGYPFARDRHWVEAVASTANVVGAAPVALHVVEPANVVAPAPSAPEDPVEASDTLPRLIALIEDVSGFEIADAETGTPWLELGLDSLALTQLALQLQRAFQVKVTFRQIMEQYGTAAQLAAHLDASRAPSAPAATTTSLQPAVASTATATPGDEDAGEGPMSYDVKKAFGAIARIHTRADAMTPRQRTRLDALIARYVARTAKSKAYTVQHRERMADPRVVNGFRPLTKELTYQLVIERSRNSRMWDLDGNEYVDVLNGFGMNLFGWQPDFLRDTLHERIDLGYEIGPQHVLAGETAELFAELTGTDRVAFCNTGSEAVMGTMRIARTVTGRSTIAIFTGAYHGIFDEVIVRGTKKLRSVPAAPGIMPSTAQNVLVLDYGTEESLQILRERAHELAAVLVEPVQSRRPDFQPVEFLREVRKLTEESGALLIFDEVVTGFRAHPRGVQGLFDIQADLGAYGKVVGGGFSIGVIAGKRAYMDALDGGHWDYGDDSVPTVGVTYFAGTFVRHPLALAAAKATLQHLYDAGPELQQRLTARTAGMVARVNAAMEEMGAPFKLVTFASWWRNVFTEDLPYADLIYVMLRDRGIHILDNFPCFLTTSHTDEDIDLIVEAYRDAAAEMIASEFFPVRRKELAAADDGTRVVPTTEPQREIWLADRLGTEASLAYNESVSLHLRGALDVERLRAAVRALPQRHDALRATFSDDGLWLKVPKQAPAFDVALRDLSTSADPQAALAAICERHVSEAFDLIEGPLLRAEIVRIAPEHHVLVLTGHHIVLDGWSFWAVVKDLAAQYRPLQAGAAHDDAPSFADYAAAQSASDADPADELAWWIALFADGGPVLDLPCDRPRPPIRTQRAGREDHLLPADLLADVRQLGTRRGASLFATLLAGFSALLHRLTGQDDMVIGVPAAGQAAAGLEGLVGHCVHMLPLRLQPHGEQPFASLVEQSRGMLLDAYDHQRITFGRLLRALPIARDRSRLPLMSVIFNIDQALTGEHDAMPGLQLDLDSNARRFETFELFVNAVDLGAAGMRLECQYNSDLFDARTVARWLSGFESLLRGAVADADRAVDALPVLTPEDQRLIDGWNATAADYPRDARIDALILDQAHRTPDAVAVVAGSQCLHYAQLAERSAAIAAALQAAGVQRGDRVGLLLERDLQLLPVLLGVLRAGACYVPLDPAMPEDRLGFMVEDAQLGVLLGDAALMAKFDDVLSSTTRLSLHEIPERSDADVRDADGSAEDDAYIIYTSGSTGRPKGVRVRHRNVVNLLDSMRRTPGMQAQDVVLAVTTLAFDIAVCELILPLSVGATVVLADRRDAADADRLRGLLETQQVSILQATPATWRLLLESGWSGAPGLKALSGGEPLAADLAAALLPRVAELWNVYGPTETTVWSSHHRVVDADAPIPIGVPLANTQLLVLDRHRQPLPVGVVGELYIGGDGVACGYLNRPELTAERFVPGANGEPIYRTGDLARWRSDGVVECLGRTDFQVKLRGYRIELGEIEQVLLTHPDIAQAVVATYEPRPGDQRLIAYVIAHPDAAFDGSRAGEDALRAHAATLLPEYMLPQRFIALPVLPLTVSGKVDRKALPAPTDALLPVDDAPETFSDPWESQVAQQYREALALPRIGRHDDFFALGGHSLLAAQLAAKLGRALDRHVPMRAVFDHPTVAGLAAWLAAQDTTTLPAIPVLASGERAPLSLMQQRVWYLEQLHPGRTVYNVPSAHRLRGALDRDALGRAFAAMVQRQAALRTTIGMHDGEPFQAIHDAIRDALDASLRFEDLTGIAADARETELALRMEDEIAVPFDLARGPLFRACVYRLGDDDHVMFFMAHHAIWDGWSFDLFYTEMAALYDAFRHGREPSLAPMPVGYADFSAWHRAWMAGPELTRQLDHWRRKLAGAPEALALPIDKPRPATQSGDGDTAWLRVPADTADALRALAQREGSTLFTVLLSAWTLLLHQLSGQRDLVIGTPVRGRNLPELESVMGFFVNALPLRLRLDPTQGFRSLLQATRVEMIDALGCQDVPFEHLVRVLDTRRDTSRFPIYQAFFSYQDARQRPCRWGDLLHANVPVFQPAAAQDVALWFLDGADGLVGGLNYNTDILIADTATLLVERYLALLDRLVDALTQPSQDVPLRALLAMAPAESARLAAWNDTAAPLPADRDLSHYLDDAIARHGERAQVLSGDTVITHAALSAQADRIAAALRDRGIGPGAVVGLHLQRSPTMLAAMLGVLRAGAAYLPLDPAFPLERLTFMVEDAEAPLVVDDSDNALGLDPAQRLALDVALATETVPGLRSAHGNDDALAYLIYTSGSTGKPKGVRVPQRAVINFLESMRTVPGLTEASRLAAVTTLSFDIAVLELLLPLAVGADLVLVGRDEASDGVALRTLLERHNVDTMQATPGTWRLLLESGWRGGPQWTALCGGEALPADLAEALMPRVGALWNMYGPTETTVWSTCAQVRPGQGEIVVGRPIANTQVHVLDDDGAPVPIGVAGELVIAGAGVTLGYHKRDALTDEKFIVDPASPGARMYRTGDLGRWRSDGQLQHLGRLDQQIKLRGYRIETGEIESVLAQHPDVAQTVVVAASRGHEDAILAAYVVPRAGAGVDDAALRAHLRGQLPDYMLPTAWIEIVQVPTTPNGKVDRNALPPVVSAAAPVRSLTSQAPSTASERAVAEIWRELLGVQTIGVQDNFLDIGGHSLLIMRAVAMLHTRCGVNLSPRVFVFQTLGQIAAECDALAGAAVTNDAAGAAVIEATPPPGMFGRLLSRFGKRRAH